MLRIERCTDTLSRAIAKHTIDIWHSYIKFADRPSRKLYWLLWECDTLIGVFGLGSCFHKPKAMRDFMAEHNVAFNEVGNNIVFCLLPNHSKNAGSKALKLVRNDAKQWWMERYGDTLRYMQTFIEPPRTGAVYKADNWIEIGITSGAPQHVRTLYGDEIDAHPEAERRVFKSGEIRYLLREQVKGTQKRILIRKT